MSENLLNIPRLSIVFTTAKELGIYEPKKLLPIINKAHLVNEVSKTTVCPINTSIYSGGYLYCVGSFIMGGTSVMMTHHNPIELEERGNTDTEIQKVAEKARQLSDGVGVIWKKSFFRVKSKDFVYRDAAELWYEKLKMKYLSNILSVYEMTFSVWDSPLSAYYDGSAVLTMISNLDINDELVLPRVKKLK